MGLTLLLFFQIIITVLGSNTIKLQQGRAPHGLASEKPMSSISPSAYEFFHPKVITGTTYSPASDLSSGSKGEAADHSMPMYYWSAPNVPNQGGKITVASGLVVGLGVFGMLLALAASYIIIKRRADHEMIKKAKPVFVSDNKLDLA